MPRPSRLRHRVSLQSLTQGAPDGAGGYAYSWTEFDNVAGRLIDRRGQERNAAGGVDAETTHMIEIRYLATVTAEHIAVIGADEYTINAVLHDERRRWTTLHCKQGVAE